MKKILAFLPKLGIALLVLPLIGVNLAMAYIMFAPDTWPKPFYLQYVFPTLPENASAETNNGGKETAHAAEPKPAASSEHSSSSGSEESAAEAPSVPLEIRPGQGLMVDTGSKIVNLVDPTGRRYLRTGIVLEYAPRDLTYYVMTGEEKALFLEEFNAEIETILPVVNDIIITALSTQTFESVYTAEGKEALRAQIMNTINSQVPEQRIIFVYFTEFVVQ
ncbi:MAG: flagellar basal body-associated FliL family protein [Chloroflexi bacterium]|nr:flagellar basal body-associated FliL family protein [Chloroflexota bacterium]